MIRKIFLIFLVIGCILIVAFIGGFLYYTFSSLVKKPYITPAVKEGEGYPSLSTTLGKTSGSTTFSYVLERKIIYEAEIHIEVENSIERVLNDIKDKAYKLNGYIASLNMYKDKAILVVKIPCKNFTQYVDYLDKYNVVKKNIIASDVTEQYIDLNARLRNARAEESRLLQFFNMAKNVDDLIKIESYLKRVREEIELLEARIKNLERRVEYSRVAITISEMIGKRQEREIVFPEFNPWPAIIFGIQIMYNVIYGIIVLFIAIIPLAVISLPMYLLYRKGYIKGFAKHLSPHSNPS